ncbi:MAG TPA: hypothetical protein VHV27_05815 [Phenylobacterium sp.]|jgi:hypothetical protein|nr:hypothetical protein [Phenylobacterium sp.]
MPTYRAYKVDRRRHITAAQWIDAPDDLAAKVEAKQELCEDGTPIVELWQAARLVDEIDCDDG